MKFGFGDMIAPRLGVTWDPAGKGRSRIFARYDRSYESVPLVLNSFAFAFDYSYGYNFGYPEDGSLPSANNLGKLINAAPNGGSVRHVDPDLKPMYSDQFALGIEYQIGSEISVGLTGIYNTVGNVIDDLSLDGYRTSFFGNPGGVIRVHPVTGEILETPILYPEPVHAIDLVGRPQRGALTDAS
jgi:outer membrane receptor protein involved in Fe transport